MAIEISQIKAGSSLPGMQKAITQEDINLYARASRDFNPIHVDPEFARSTPLGGTVAHGMLVLAYVSQMMTEAFGKSWLTGGSLNVRFKAPARPGDTILVQGKIESVEPGEAFTQVKCGVQCLNQNGETVINGDAKVRLNK
jgi:3-hydroxybutyryl-CoA dehydratase